MYVSSTDVSGYKFNIPLHTNPRTYMCQLLRNYDVQDRGECHHHFADCIPNTDDKHWKFNLFYSVRLGARRTFSDLSTDKSNTGAFGSMSAQRVPMRTPNAVTCFDDSKMTRNAVAYAHDSIFRSPVDRIGMYRSPHALHLTVSAVHEHIQGSAFSSPMPSREPAVVSHFTYFKWIHT